MTKLLQQCFLFFIVVVIPGHNLGNSQVSVNRTIGPTLVILYLTLFPQECWFYNFDILLYVKIYKLGFSFKCKFILIKK